MQTPTARSGIKSESTSWVPFAASSAWYAAYIAARLAGHDEAEAEWAASAAFPGLRRHCNRAVVGVGELQQTLTLPVAGSARALKSLRPGDLVIAEHGNWRRQHLGALAALYGRTPFYQHLIPEIEALYASDVEMLCDFNRRLHDIIVDFLDIGSAVEAVGKHCGLPPAVSATGSEMADAAEPAVSILDAAFRLGPDAIFPLLAAL